MSSDIGGHLDSKADMAKCARKIVEYCADVKPSETIIVISDDSQSDNVYQSIFNAAHSIGAKATLMITPTPEYGIVGEPLQSQESVLAAARIADCVISCGLTSVGKKLLEVIEFEKKSRMLMVQKMSEDSIIRTTSVDFAQVADETEKLTGTFETAKEVEITSPSGTQITIDITGSRTAVARGSFKIDTPHAPHNSRIEFLPSGRIGTFFENKMFNGTIITDSFLDLGVAKAGVELVVKNGRVAEVKGRNADQWYVDSLRALFKLDANANNIGEIGLGTNPRARLVGSYEDFGVLGSIRIGFGSIGSTKSVFRSGCFIMNGTMKLDGKTLVDHGELVQNN
jgi:2,5-dihydroxypyridine 5,6-dioxygenase